MIKEKFLPVEVGYGAVKNLSSYNAGVDAAKEAMKAILRTSPSVVLVFASVCYSLEEVLAGVYSIVGDVPTIGATTAGEICNEQYSQSVLVTILASPYLKVHYAVGKNVSKNWRKALDEAVDDPALQSFFRNSEYKWQMRRQGKSAFALVFTPGLTKTASCNNNCIIEAIKQKSYGDFPIVGGAAADDLQMEKNYVLCGRKAYEDGLLIAIFETELQFGITLMHGLRATQNTATVTEVEGNEILSLDNEKADIVYRRLTGLSEQAQTGRDLTYAPRSVLGVTDISGKYTVNMDATITRRGGIMLTQPVSLGTVVSQMEADNDRMLLAGVGSIQLAKIRGGITEPAIGFVFYCTLRPRLMGGKSQAELAGMKETLAGKPMVGFMGYGGHGVTENGDSQHNHFSVVCLVIGNRLSHTGRVAIENRGLLDALQAQKEELISINAALMNEIYERLKTEEALRASEDKLKDFAQAVPDISMIIDEDGRYIEVFDRGTMEWKKKQEIIGMTISELFLPSDAALMYEQLRNTISSGKPQYLAHVMEIQGSVKVIEGRMAPMTYLANGRRTVALVVTDITEKYKAEKLLQETYELRRKSDFFSDIIFGNMVVDEKVIQAARKFGVDLTASLFFCLIAVVDIPDELKADSSSTAEISLKSDIICLLNQETDYLAWDSRDGVGVICSLRKEEKFKKQCTMAAQSLLKKINTSFPEVKVLVGVSNEHGGQDSLRTAYRQALHAVAVAKCQEDSEAAISYYADLGIFQLLASVGGKAQAQQFIQDKIGKLIIYDETKGTKFLETLEEILQSSSLKEVADKLFLHHKTVVFRRQRIEKILEVSLEDFEIKLALAAAVKLYKLNKILEK